MTIKIDERARLAAAIAARRTPSSALPEDVRRDAIAYTRRRVAQGASQAAVAHELAVTTMTVSRWLSMARLSAAKPKPSPKSAPKLRPVRVVDAPKSSRGAIVVTTTYGLRIEGLAAEDVVAILRALG
jgi:hypothetical protein